jgi:hypothetical protein
MRKLLALAAFLPIAIAGCGDTISSNLFDGLEEALREGYNFSACSDSGPSLDECSTCCSDANFTSSAVFNDTECGCTTNMIDTEVCAASNTDFETCTACCTTNGDQGSSFGGVGGEETCECFSNTDQRNRQPTEQSAGGAGSGGSR